MWMAWIVSLSDNMKWSMDFIQTIAFNESLSETDILDIS